MGPAQDHAKDFIVQCLETLIEICSAHRTPAAQVETILSQRLVTEILETIGAACQAFPDDQKLAMSAEKLVACAYLLQEPVEKSSAIAEGHSCVTAAPPPAPHRRWRRRFRREHQVSDTHFVDTLDCHIAAASIELAVADSMVEMTGWDVVRQAARLQEVILGARR